MSTADAPAVDPAPARPVPASPRPGGPLAWASIACALLVGSGAARLVQERRHQVDQAYKESCPLELGKIPAQMGDWKLVDGSEKPLDALTMRIAGGTDHLVRTYSNRYTGVSVIALILFGPAEPVMPHVPAVCYPSSGFTLGDVEATRSVDFPAGVDASGKPIEGHALFQSASYAKPAGRTTIREAVYHSFRLDGEWSPFIGSGRKFPRRNPGVFKVQVQRQVAEGETLDKGDPIEDFLKSLLGEMEGLMKSPAAAAAAKGLAAR